MDAARNTLLRVFIRPPFLYSQVSDSIHRPEPARTTSSSVAYDSWRLLLDLLINAHKVHRHELRKSGIIGGRLVGPGAGNIHDQVHGTVEGPAYLGVFGVGEDLGVIQEKVHVVRIPFHGVEVELVIHVIHRDSLGWGSSLGSVDVDSGAIGTTSPTLHEIDFPLGRFSAAGTSRRALNLLAI